MDDADIAKKILIDNNAIIKAYSTNIIGNLSRPPQNHTEIVFSMSSFEPVEYLKFNLPIAIKDTVNFKPSQCSIFTNWHLENQDMKRLVEDFYIWEGNKIYKDELIRSVVSDCKFKEDEKNPFVRVLYIEATLTFRILESVARVLLPQLKSIYITHNVIH